jgi:hypothetical protein
MEHLVPEKLCIDKSKYTPLINFDPMTRVLAVEGNSYPENSFLFYAPIFEWLKAYFSQGVDQKTIVNLEIIYFNSSSSKLLFDFFDMLKAAGKSHDIEINWIFDERNEMALEAGEDFKEDFPDLNFNLVEKM